MVRRGSFESPGRLPVCGERPTGFLQALVDDLNDGVRSRIDENRLIVDDRVAISADAIFGRHVVIDDAVPRQMGRFAPLPYNGTTDGVRA